MAHSQLTAQLFDTEIRTLLARAGECGLTHVEVFARRDTALTLRAHVGKLESFQRSDSVGLGVRVLLGERVGYAYTENLAVPALERALAEAAANAELVEGQPGAALAEPGSAAPDMPGLSDPSLGEVPLAEKVALVLHLEEITRTADPRVKAVPGCSYADSATFLRVANSLGLDRHYRTNTCYTLIYPIVSDAGENKTCHEIELARSFAGLDVEKLSALVLVNALGRLGAQEIKSGPYPVVFTPRTMVDLLSAFSDTFSAKAAQDGKSLLAGKLGLPVASPLIRVVDDARLPTGFASRPFDDEGVASRPIALIDRGVFNTFLHNTQTARMARTASTGHAARGGYKGILDVAPSNLYIEGGTTGAAALVQADGPLVVIDDLQGLHAGTNPISGDFSLAAQGHLYLNGVRQHAVHQFTVAGNFLALLAAVEAVGDDLRFYPHGAYIGSPSVRVRELAIAGA